MNSAILTFYEFVLNNRGKFDKDTVKSFFSYIFDLFKKDLHKVVLLRMNYPGYSDVDISAINNNVLAYYEKEIDKAKKGIDEQLTGKKLDVVINKLNQKNNLIPELQIGFENNIFRKRMMDTKYPYIPSVIKFEEYKESNRDNSFTKFVTIMLAIQHPDYYLPQTYMTLLESSPLYGTTCSDIGTSVFTPDMIRSPTKVVADNKLNILKHFGTTPLTNICLYLSKSEVAINKTTTNLMNSYYATNLISAIPNILRVLYQCSKLFDDNYYYTPVLRSTGIPKVTIDARMEISVLSQILIKLYNEVLPISNNIQFMDYLNTNASHSFTELIENLNTSDISFESKRPLNYIEWINPIVNIGFGINYDKYDRFEKYNNTFLKPLNDVNFAKLHDEIKELIAKIIGNSLILSTNFVGLNPNPREELPLMGGNIPYNISYNMNDTRKMYGGADTNEKYLDEIIENISKNPRVLALAGVYNIDENMIVHLFKRLYSKTNSYNEAFSKADFSVPLATDSSTSATIGTMTFNNASSTAITSPQQTSLLHALNNLDVKEEHIDFIRSYIQRILSGMYNTNIRDFNAAISDHATQTIKNLSTKFTNDGFSMSNPLFDMALVYSLGVTIDYLDLIHLLDINEDIALAKVKLSPIVKRLFTPNELIGGVNTSTFDSRMYKHGIKYEQLTNDEMLSICRKLYNATDTTLATIASVTMAYIVGANKKLTYEHYLNVVNEECVGNKSYVKKAYIDYLVTITWNSVSIKFLFDEFKKGYDLYYHLFINTIIIASHIYKKDELFGDSLRKIYESYTDGATTTLINIESYVASLLSMWSSIALKSDGTNRISEFYSKQYIKSNVTPNNNVQLTFMKSELDHTNENDANVICGDGSKTLTDLFTDKFLNVFNNSLKDNDNTNLISLGLLKLAGSNEITNHYSIGPFKCQDTSTNMTTGVVPAYYKFDAAITTCSATLTLEQTMRKCATALMCNIIFPDVKEEATNDIFSTQATNVPRMLKFDNVSNLITNGRFIGDGVTNFDSVGLYAAGSVLVYLGYKTAAQDQSINVELDSTTTVSAAVSNASSEALTCNQETVLDVGSFVNASFLGSSNLNQLMALMRGLYIYSNVDKEKIKSINNWNLIDEYMKESKIELSSTKKTMQAIFAPISPTVPSKYAELISQVKATAAGGKLI